MANKRALAFAGKRRAQRKEEYSRAKKTKFWPLAPWGRTDGKDPKKKSKKTKKLIGYEAFNLTPLVPLAGMVDSFLHGFKGKKFLKTQEFCGVEQYGDKDCAICDTEGNYGPNRPYFYRAWLAYNHNREGKYRRTKKGERVKWNPLCIVLLPEGEDEVHFETLEAGYKNLKDPEKDFLKLVYQFKKLKKGIAFQRLSKEDIARLPNKGIVPKDLRAEVLAWDLDYVIGHTINAFAEARFEWFDVPEPEPEESDDDDDDDDDEDEDDDDDSSDDEDEDDEDEDEKPKSKKKKPVKKTKAKPTKPKSKSKKKAHWSDDDDDEDDDDEDDEDEDEDEDEDDEDDEDEEEDEKPAKKKKPVKKTKPKPKSKIKPKSKSKKKVEDDDDDDDDEDEDDDIDDDYDDDDDDDEDEDDED